MSYTSADCAYKLLGVYHIHRKPGDVWYTPRDFVGIGHRISGNSTFTYHNGTLQAKSGSTLFLPAGVGFRSFRDTEEELVILHLQPFGNVPEDFRLYEDTAHLSPLFRKLFSLWEQGSYNSCMVLLYELFSALDAPAAQVPAVIAPGVALLRRDFRDPKLTVAQAAKACFISEVYFRRIYRGHFGSSPLQDLRDLRFRYAMQLLRSGYYSQKDVAALSGFTDVKYFRTAFQARYHLTPSQWQQKNMP